MKKFDILGIGTAAVDDLIFVENFPIPDSKSNILSQLRQGGGQTATAMVAASRLGAQVAFCCQLGFDSLSDFTISELTTEGVDCSPCVRTKLGNPYHSIIIVDTHTHSRTILHSGGNLCPSLDVITHDLIRSASILCLDDNSRGAGIKAAQIANSFGIPVVADIEPDPPPEFVDLLPFVDHLVIGHEFGVFLTGLGEENAISEHLGIKRSCCIVTSGDKGCWYSHGGSRSIHIPAFPVPVVDTTGCGDVFHGAYAAALVNHKDIESALRIASAAAAMKAMHPGGRTGIPTMESIQRFLIDHNTVL